MKWTLVTLLVCFAVGTWGQGFSDPSLLTLGPGDLISVEVFDVPELKQEIRISDTGEAQLALLGKVHLAGMTVMEAQQLLAARLQAERFVVAPQVSLLVREYATQNVSVSGEVRKPGVYQMLGPRTLLQLAAEAGGLTETASPKIMVRHASGEEELIDATDAKPAWRSKLLRPGDTVVVRRAGIAYLVGDVARSGGYLMQDGGTLSVGQLVALGGGTLHTAKASHAKLVRKSGDRRQEIELDVPQILRGRAPDLQLQADDILFIPNSAWKNATNRLANITHIMPGSRIGKNCNLGDHVFVETGAVLGDDVTVKNGVSIWDGVTAENKVFIGPNVVFTNDRNPRAHVKKTRDQFLETRVREGASLGANVTVVCGITVGRHAFAGAGAVLTKDVPDHAIVIGNPARWDGYMCECGTRLHTDLTCRCGLRFARENGQVVRVPF